MYLCNEQLTIYNRFTNANKRKEYVPTVISGIHWFGTEQVSVIKDGLVSARMVKIRIPLEADTQGKTFVLPKEYHKATDKSRLFTIEEGDIIVKGNASEENTSPSTLQEKYNEVVTVISVTDNRNAPNAKHWRVVCK